jgi:uridine kinase
MTDLVETTAVVISEPRQTVRVTFPDSTVLEGKVGTTIEQFIIAYSQAVQPQVDVMGGILEGRLRELGRPVMADARLEPIHLRHSDGGRIYRRSLIMLMTAALDGLFPGVRVNVRYALPEGGFYCKLTNRPPLDADELAHLENHMRAIVAANEPIRKEVVPLEDAQKLFAEREDDDKVRLLEQRTRKTLVLYTLRGRQDYYYGYMLPATGYLKYFRLLNAEGGFILQYPRRENGTELQPIALHSKIGAIFRQADEWLEKMDIEDVGHLNRIIHTNRVHELILVAEALHEQQIATIAQSIVTEHTRRGVQLVLIAGPSSSGKTTFSKRLAIQLLAQGLRPFTVELDNYFVNRELTPRDADGQYNFEALEAINRPLFNQHLLRLMNGEEVQLPRFDFQSGKSLDGRVARLKPNQIIIIEGIHGLNPGLVPDIPGEKIFRIYISALTTLNTDAHNRTSTTDLRLLRRIARDAQHRGYSATDTIQRWPSVRRGEKANIFPYQDYADAMFNSALAYEVASLRPLAEPLLLQVEPGTPPHIEANRLLSFLRWVQPLSPEQSQVVPDNSLLREFIGGSSLHDYHPGVMHDE